MLYESDAFFDRALALYLWRSHLRELQASTWAGVATYYSNYFLALGFIRLHMIAVTELPTGPVFEVTRSDDRAPYFKVQERSQRQRHADVWRTYYDVVTRMAWPDRPTVTTIAPTLGSLRFREQLYRERINYRLGEGSNEIYLARARYLESLRASLVDDGRAATALSDAAYTDRMAAQRLRHMATLLDRLSGVRMDSDIEAALWQRRRNMVERYARDQADKRFGGSLISRAA